MRRFSVVLAAFTVAVVSLLSSQPAHADVFATIVGKVTDVNGNPLRQITVRPNAFDDPGSDWGGGLATLTDDNGSYRIFVRPGEWTLIARDDLWLGEFPTQYYPGVADRSQAKPFEAVDGQTTTVNFVLPSSYSHTRSATAIDTNDRDAVTRDFRDHFQRNLGLAAAQPTKAESSSCKAGPGDAGLDAATIDSVNFVRSMVGLERVRLDPAISQRARNVALLMRLNNKLSLYPPADWLCWTQDGYYDARGSALARHVGAEAVVEDMAAKLDPTITDDPVVRDNPAFVDGRDTILQPDIRAVGSGAVGSVSAIYPGESQPTRRSPRFVSWPTAGWFPTQLIPYDRWSFDAADMSYNFERATVAVTELGANGRTFAAQTHVAGAYSPLVWTMPEIPQVTGTNTAEYRITIGKMLYRGAYQPDYTYTVRMFAPPELIRPIHNPTVTGTARVGSTLTGHPPTWSTGGVTTTYQWLRDGRPITGATRNTLTLGATDVGHRLSIRATGAKPDSWTGTTTSAQTAATVKKSAIAKLSARQSKRTVTLTVRVAATGEPGLGEKVTINDGSRRIKTLTLKSGSATVKLTKVSKRTHTYMLRYPGNSRVSPATASVRVKVK